MPCLTHFHALPQRKAADEQIEAHDDLYSPSCYEHILCHQGCLKESAINKAVNYSVEVANK